MAISTRASSLLGLCMPTAAPASPLPFMLQFAVVNSEPCTLTTAQGTHMTLTGCGPQHSPTPQQQSPAVWELCILHGGRVALRDPGSGRYLSARPDGSIRSMTHLLKFETWELVPVDASGSKAAFMSVHGGQLLQACEKGVLRLGQPQTAAGLHAGHCAVFHRERRCNPDSSAPARCDVAHPFDMVRHGRSATSFRAKYRA